MAQDDLAAASTTSRSKAPGALSRAESTRCDAWRSQQRLDVETERADMPRHTGSGAMTGGGCGLYTATSARWLQHSSSVVCGMVADRPILVTIA